jgi:cation diffusion facilitator family transporter
MLAESIHSLCDCFNQLGLFFGVKTSKKKPTKMHSFGYGKTQFFWSFVVAISLFIAGGLFSFYKGIEKVFNPHKIENIHIQIIIIILGMCLETWSFLTAIKKARTQKKDDLSYFQFIKQTKDSSLIVILLEDFMAITGLVIILITSLLTNINPIFDGIGAILIGILLTCASFIIFREVQSLLLGESVNKETYTKIVNLISTHAKVDNVPFLQTMHLGSNNILICSKITLKDDIKMDEVANIINDIEQDLRDLLDEELEIFIEPDLFYDDR